MKSWKIKNIIIIALAISTIPISAMLFVLFAYTIKQNELRSTEIIESTQQTMLDSLNFTISSINTTIKKISHEMDFLIFSNSSNRSRIASRASEIAHKARQELSPLSPVTAVFLYNSECDYLYKSYKVKESYYIQPEVEKLLKSETEPASGQWTVKTIQEKPILFYAVRSRYGCILVAIDPSSDDSFINLSKASGEDSRWYYEEIPEVISAANDNANIDYNSITTAAEMINIRLIYSWPQKSLAQRIDQRQKMMLALMLIMIFFVPVIWIFVNMTLLNPLDRLADSINKIRHGHLDQRVAINSHICELREFAFSFNDMLDSIQELKVENYEYQLSASRARLQYLQLQIRPHFYLNCLKNMNSLLDLKEYENIREMIFALSSYFSHTFHDVKNFVTLLDELDACTSYIRLQNIISKKTELTFDIENRCINALCLPMSILTFVENCIKHGMNHGAMNIQISAFIIRNEAGREDLTVTISDNGGGFSEAALKDLMDNDPSKMSYRHTKIGVANVCYRYWLIYRDSAHISFRNENNGAVVEICMPFEQKEEEEP